MKFGSLEYIVLDNLGAGQMKDDSLNDTQEIKGGYCSKCDTVWCEPGRCDCDPLLAEHETALNVYAIEIWNEAIEAAILIMDNDTDRNNLRSLKK